MEHMFALDIYTGKLQKKNDLLFFQTVSKF